MGASAALAEASAYHDFTAFGFAAILINDKQHSYALKDIPLALENVPTDADVILSQASFRVRNRRLVNLNRLGNNFVDLEMHKTDYCNRTPEHQAQEVVIYCEDKGLPRPSHINYSGRGLHVKWCFDMPLPAQALPRWNAVEKQLIKTLKPFCPDKAARDGSRCLRVVGSANPRSGQMARTVWQENVRYDFDLLAHEVLPISREEIHRQRQAKREATIAGTGRSCNWWSTEQLWWNRLADMRKLIELRGWTDGVPGKLRLTFVWIGEHWAYKGIKKE